MINALQMSSRDIVVFFYCVESAFTEDMEKIGKGYMEGNGEISAIKK